MLTGLLLASAIGFATLSAWQWQRLAWKEALLARIARQQAAAPQPLAAPAAWAGISRDNDEYRPVTLRGHLEPQREIRVLASTELGRGHWVMVPLRIAHSHTDGSPDGARVWLNRGFVDDAHTEPATRPAPTGEITVTGLLRFSEAGQWLWQRNDPASGRWVGRDLAAMSRAARISAAPFFIDVAEAGERPVAEAIGTDGAPAVPHATARNAGFPRGGLTVLRFSNNHLVYALTWLALAAGTVVAAAVLWRLAPARRAA
ncbi:SURF1 family cytochrome oxidase biogenesis protein [Ideonella sp. DXS22W]|uniref:SURF1-like protein n=1 Tax=Pseudaquabacterium inlustre TaxID=2984192 RepID=A0ABU9CEQ0_9BURK